MNVLLGILGLNALVCSVELGLSVIGLAPSCLGGGFDLMVLIGLVIEPVASVPFV